LSALFARRFRRRIRGDSTVWPAWRQLARAAAAAGGAAVLHGLVLQAALPDEQAGVETGHEASGTPSVAGDAEPALDAALLEESRARAALASGGNGGQATVAPVEVQDDDPAGKRDSKLLSQDDPLARALHESAPHFSAYGTQLSRTQRIAVAAVVVPTAVGIVLNPSLTAQFWVGVATAVFVFLILFRFYVVRRGWGANATIDPPREELALLDDGQLRVYTVLVPLYREKRETILQLLAALAELDYPQDKLDGLLLVEDDDLETRGVLDDLLLPHWVRVLLVPAGLPRTKPKALLHGLRAARGEHLTIYDAEDKPDRLQLKKAAWAFANTDDSVACLQAKLGYYNGRQNLLTRWFNLEYDDWFNLFLPGLHDMGAPIPLGGTSNHFDVFTLCESFAWDPHNVTEDADLGLRLARLGRTTAMLESTTNEEANSKLLNWLRQRSRWMKGYFQTILVHTRSPRTLYRDLGLRRSIEFFAAFLGGPFVALVSPIFWSMLILWLVAQPAWISELFTGWVYYASLASFVLGTFFLLFFALLAAVGRGDDDLTPYSLLIPVYWLLISAAAYIALFELVVRPYHWHKTEHGLHLQEEHG
jgi:glycosyltransferase XagB